MNRLRAARPTTCIYIQIKRLTNTYFILCDEYDPVESLKSRILNVLEQSGFRLERLEEPMTTDDFRLCLKKRVSVPLLFLFFIMSVSTFHFNFLTTKFICFRYWITKLHVTTSKCSITASFISASRNQALLNLKHWQMSLQESTSNTIFREMFARERRTKLMEIEINYQLDQIQTNLNHITF